MLFCATKNQKSTRSSREAFEKQTSSETEKREERIQESVAASPKLIIPDSSLEGNILLEADSHELTSGLKLMYTTLNSPWAWQPWLLVKSYER